MSQFDAQGYQERIIELEGWPARVSSYQLATRWSCRVDNVSPGATVARGEGATREEAETRTLEVAARRFRATRRLGLPAGESGNVPDE